MAEIGFYHLTRSSVEEALPQLLGRTLEAGQRAVIRCKDAAQVKALDAALWKVRDPVWLPHGSKAMGHAPRQPIWLTEGEDAPNGAAFVFLLDGGAELGLENFARIFDLFDGRDEAAVGRARKRWTAMKSAGHELAYWQQQPRGWHRAR
ncbi:DNA polymerase III subunit chi [Kozakia baliensis]|uniref:DNA polymerase III subunit chi n=1 Tax=Kozakia baliensis TaxID=153496 RepID=A0A1D8UQK2_9PROT|nr:DNA polymerase III subunit chi [Kozakia baliensis]AOX15923.1 DNA polymerase III subunit chi [Kozakia baliensis]AOX21012.1 DNA polymerase III subunit chi [Kozakia baliensis]GBR27518.1 DNA polymerase III subunit chi [Kozakia baliensis NRIC 0488]GEL64190.1 DNA polymerase III subunit chi [Kozakia baliensis]